MINRNQMSKSEMTSKIKSLMNINESSQSKSNHGFELVKKGADGNAYAIVKENHEYFIKKAKIKENLNYSDFNYIGGLANKRSFVFESFSKATQSLNLRLMDLNENFGFVDSGEFNLFKNDMEVSEVPPMVSLGDDIEMVPEEDMIEMSDEEIAIDNMITGIIPDDEPQAELPIESHEEDPIDSMADRIMEQYKKLDSILKIDDVKKKTLDETKYTLKVPNAEPEVSPEPEMSNDLPDMGDSNGGEEISATNTDSGNDKPFDDEPFDAGVEASEEEDPKKFIQQLSGKLGQSLRKYSDETGQPDFELEKFAINSVVSATHTSEMDENDREDIINKINSSGMDDENNSENEINTDNDSDLSDEGDETPIQNDEEDNQDIKLENSQIWEPIDKESKPLFVDATLGVDLQESNPCWSGYKQLGTKEKNGKEVPNCVPINENDLGETYTHFAILLKSNKIVNGWDYSGVDTPSIKEYTREDLRNDFPDHKLSDFKVVTKKNLINSGINPNDSSNWIKYEGSEINETIENIYAFYLKENFENKTNSDIFEEKESMDNPVETPVKPQISEPERRIKRKSKPFHLPNRPQVSPTPKALKEEVKDDYQVYHNTYGSAIETALEYAEDRGYEYSHEEYFNKIASGPRKPSNGDTNKISMTLYKDGEEIKEMLHIQVYGMGNKYELNCYIN